MPHLRTGFAGWFQRGVQPWAFPSSLCCLQFDQDWLLPFSRILKLGAYDGARGVIGGRSVGRRSRGSITAVRSLRCPQRCCALPDLAGPAYGTAGHAATKITIPTAVTSYWSRCPTGQLVAALSATSTTDNLPPGHGTARPARTHLRRSAAGLAVAAGCPAIALAAPGEDARLACLPEPSEALHRHRRKALVGSPPHRCQAARSSHTTCFLIGTHLPRSKRYSVSPSSVKFDSRTGHEGRRWGSGAISTSRGSLAVCRRAYGEGPGHRLHDRRVG